MLIGQKFWGGFFLMNQLLQLHHFIIQFAVFWVKATLHFSSDKLLLETL